MEDAAHGQPHTPRVRGVEAKVKAEYSVILIPEPECGFTVLIPSFPEYVGYAETAGEASALAHTGIAFELERLHAIGQPTPGDHGIPELYRVAA